jgi:hypothetical protein
MRAGFFSPRAIATEIRRHMDNLDRIIVTTRGSGSPPLPDELSPLPIRERNRRMAHAVGPRRRISDQAAVTPVSGPF